MAAVEADPAHVGELGTIDVSDDEIRESLEANQLRLQRERGADLTIFSPRASWMGHHVGNEHTSAALDARTRTTSSTASASCTRTTSRRCASCPSRPVLPSTAASPNCAAASRSSGFVGCNVNPDPSGGYWTGPPLSDRAWWPLWEAMCELDVPGMIHVSASCNPQFQTTGSHYLGADTTAFVQALTSGFLRDFPGLRWIIPHGGGAVPYHWGRFQGMAADNGWDLDAVMEHVVFDTCVYHQRGIDLLVDVVPVDNILFGSEMIGAVRGIDPATGHHYDDTKRYLDAAALDAAAKERIFATQRPAGVPAGLDAPARRARAQ